MGHKHAELMKLYAEDAMETDKPWERWESKTPKGCDWFQLDDHPFWFVRQKYRRKPKTIRIGEYDVPEPVREPLKEDQEYYYPAVGSESFSYRGQWENTGNVHHRLLGRGLVHLTREAASIHGKALASLTGDVE